MSRKDTKTSGGKAEAHSESLAPFPETILPISERPSLAEDEQLHFKRVVCAFNRYSEYVSQRIHANIHMVDSLPAEQQEFLRPYRASLDEQLQCVNHNQSICDLIVQDVAVIFDNTTGVQSEQAVNPSVGDIDRVQSTLKQFVRDWTTVGESERNACYVPIIDEILQQFPPDKCDAKEITVLVPGAGLGRLAYEIAAKGYKCQGNEFSLFMLFASNFVLNKIAHQEVYTLYPWVHQVENNLSSENQLKNVMFPDVNPHFHLQHKNNFFSMSAGDFLEIYKDNDYWDCVATCFFIDCAHNICDFIVQIFNILKPGGVWINLGPLLYHFTNMQGEQSIEPSYNHIKHIITNVGFLMEKEQTGVETRYGHNPDSMLHYTYNSVFFVCKKPRNKTRSILEHSEASAS